MSMAAQSYHRSFAPPDVSGTIPFPMSPKLLMDDGVVLELLVGNRVLHSLQCLDVTMRLVWGLLPASCSGALEVTLPEPRRIKAINISSASLPSSEAADPSLVNFFGSSLAVPKSFALTCHPVCSFARLLRRKGGLGWAGMDRLLGHPRFRSPSAQF